MPTVIRRSGSYAIADRRREVRGTLGWQVTSSVWSPPTDLYEHQDEYVVTVEVAGMNEAEFEVVVHQGVLVISGQRPDAREKRAYHQMEIHFGKFTSAAALPGPVDVEAAQAEYRNGFLVVKLPKAKSTDVKIED